MKSSPRGVRDALPVWPVNPKAGIVKTRKSRGDYFSVEDEFTRSIPENSKMIIRLLDGEL